MARFAPGSSVPGGSVSSPEGLSRLEVVLSVLLVAAFLTLVLPILLHVPSRAAGAGDERALALAAESAAEAELARANRTPAAAGLDESPAVAIDVQVEPGPRVGLERVRVTASGSAGTAGLPGTVHRFRLALVRFVR